MPDQLNERSLQVLEYNRILEMLASKCSCDDSSSLALSLRPCQTFEETREHLAETEDACRLSLKFGGPSFFGLKNTLASLHRAKIGSSLTMRELLDIAGVLTVLRTLRRYRETSRSLETQLSPLFDSLSPNKYLEEKILNSIAPEEEMLDGASSELAEIRRQKARHGSRVREELDRLIRSAKYQKSLQDPIVTIRDGRFVVPVKSECRSEIPGLVHDTSASGATVFVEPMNVVELNNQLKVLDSREQKEIERILLELSGEVGSFSDDITESYRTAVRLDFIFAKGRLSFSLNAFAPQLTEDRVIELHSARHPLIDPKTVVPVDVSLGEKFDTLVVTGPNTGGKTVALKTLGLLTLMAASGLMIPASEQSRIGFFENVLADIGDEQSIEQSLSTFSAHMTNIIRILDSAGPRSLVLLDELGSGTDPVEGAALAVSILEHLRERGTLVAATTHYAELKVYALQTPGVENASCEFDVSTLRPTYRLLIGVPGRSNAFAISQRLGLSEEIIRRAKQLVSSEDTRFEDVVRNLEESRQRMERESAAVSEDRREAEKERSAAEKIRQELEASRDRELDAARRQAKRMLESSRAQAQKLIQDIEELRRSVETEDLSRLSAQAKAQLNARIRGLEETADPIRETPRSEYRLPRPLKAGDPVMIAGINKKATVLEPPDSSGDTEVQAGIIKTRIDVSQLRLLSEKPEPVKYQVKTDVDKSKIAVKPEFDMRGQNVEEGLLELDQYLDTAQLAGLSMVSIIHGKGTGVLRSAVQQHLKKHAAVKNFRLGRYGEGENGVTIVELK